MISNEALIRYGNSKYSVNPKLIGEEVTIDVLGNRLYIYYKGKLIIFHELNKNPVNYAPEHYRILMKGKVKEAELERIASENLKIMDKILEARKVTISNIEATTSPDALIAYISDTPYGRWITGQYAHMSDENRKTFINGMNEVLPYVENKNSFMGRLKFSVKHNWCKTLDYDCLMNDFMATCKEECVLTDEGYDIIKSKYEKEFHDFVDEMTTEYGGNNTNE